jgi:hypothetical protein
LLFVQPSTGQGTTSLPEQQAQAQEPDEDRQHPQQEEV